MRKKTSVVKSFKEKLTNCIVAFQPFTTHCIISLTNKCVVRVFLTFTFFFQPAAINSFGKGRECDTNGYRRKGRSCHGSFRRSKGEIIRISGNYFYYLQKMLKVKVTIIGDLERHNLFPVYRSTEVESHVYGADWR